MLATWPKCAYILVISLLISMSASRMVRFAAHDPSLEALESVQVTKGLSYGECLLILASFVYYLEPLKRLVEVCVHKYSM